MIHFDHDNPNLVFFYRHRIVLPLSRACSTDLIQDVGVLILFATIKKYLVSVITLISISASDRIFLSVMISQESGLRSSSSFCIRIQAPLWAGGFSHGNLSYRCPSPHLTHRQVPTLVSIVPSNKL